MTTPPLRFARALSLACFLLIAAKAGADSNVCVIAWADEEYTQRKFATSPPRLEKCVYMQGRRFESFTRDDSLSRRPFIEIARFIASELRNENFEPAPNVESADILLLVHWGTTTPRVGLDTLRGRTDLGLPRDEPHQPWDAPDFHPDSEQDGAGSFFVDDTEKYRQFAFEEAERVTDSLKSDLENASNANLLGYTPLLRKLSRTAFTSTTEQSMRNDLLTERYFIIVKAYELKKQRAPGERAKPVWTLHLNMRSPGQNFGQAIARMSHVAADFAGQNSDDLEVVNPKIMRGEVEIGELKVIGVVD